MMTRERKWRAQLKEEPDMKDWKQVPMPKFEERDDDSLDDISGSSHNDINDNQLISLSVRELNKHLKSLGYDRSTVQHMKQRRRTLKNRGYAASCRNKRIEQKDGLETNKHSLVDAINKMQAENKQIKEELRQEAQKHEELLNYCHKNNIPVPEEYKTLP